MAAMLYKKKKFLFFYFHLNCHFADLVFKGGW